MPDFDADRDDLLDLRDPPPLDLPDFPELPEDDLLERLPLDDLAEEDFRDEPLEDLREPERLLVDDLLEEDFLEPPEDFPDDFPEDDLLAEDLPEDDFDDFLLPLEPFFPLPDFLPPPDCLFTVAQARRSASFFETPRSS